MKQKAFFSKSITCFNSLKRIMADYDMVLVPCFQLGSRLKAFHKGILAFHVPPILGSFLHAQKNLHSYSVEEKISLWMLWWLGYCKDKNGLLQKKPQTYPYMSPFLKAALSIGCSIKKNIENSMQNKRSLLILPAEEESIINPAIDYVFFFFSDKNWPQKKKYVYSSALSVSAIHDDTAVHWWITPWSAESHYRVAQWPFFQQKQIFKKKNQKTSLFLSFSNGMLNVLCDFCGFFDLLAHPWVKKFYPESKRILARLYKDDAKAELWKNFLKKFLLKKNIVLNGLLKKKLSFAEWQKVFLTLLSSVVPRTFWRDPWIKHLKKIPRPSTPITLYDFHAGWHFFWTTYNPWLKKHRAYFLYQPWLSRLKGPWIQGENDQQWPALATSFHTPPVKAPKVLAHTPLSPLFVPSLFYVSISQCALLQRDKGAFYRRAVLNLRTQDKTPEQEWGIMVHCLLEAFFRRCSDFRRATMQQTMLDLMPPYVMGLSSFKKRLLESLLMAFIDEECHRRNQGVIEVYSEVKGVWIVPFEKGSLKLVGRIDRLERLSDGTFMIWDYKTGLIPSFKTLETLKEPQLPLELCMWHNNAFNGFCGPLQGVGFWQLNLKTGCELKTYPLSPQILLKKTFPLVQNLFKSFVEGTYIKENEDLSS